MSGLHASNISVQYGDVRILEQASLDVEPGQVVGLIGPNGAGKSTLLRAILGFVDIVQGHITLDDEDLRNLTLKDRARKIAYAAQGAPAHWPLTVERTVALGRIPHLSAWQDMRDEDHHAVECALQSTDTLHLRERLVTTLSGGERAGVFLARAIAVHAPYLLADEPVAALDPYHQLQVMEILQRLAAEGRGVVVVLHDLSLAMRFCDSLVLLHEGKVLAHGAPKEVLTEEMIAMAYRVDAVASEHGGTAYITPWQRKD